MKRALFFVTVLAACGCSKAVPEATSQTVEAKVPIEIKGDRVGIMTLDQFREKYASDGCVVLDISENFGWAKAATPHMQVASLLGHDGPVTFANHKCFTMAYLFYDGVLESITVIPSSRVTDLFRHALTSKYGPSTSGTGHDGKPVDFWTFETTRVSLDRETAHVVVFDQALREKRLAASLEAMKKDL